MKTLNMRYPLILVCMAAMAGLTSGCDLEELCGNGVEDVGECDHLTGEHGCAADCMGETPSGEGEGEGEGEACTDGEVMCSEDNAGTTTCAAGVWGDVVACDGGMVCGTVEGAAAACAAAPCTADATMCSEDGLSLSTCDAQAQQWVEVACDAGKHCVSGDNVVAQCDWVRDTYKWIRICSKSYQRGAEYRPKSPGPDISPIEIFDSSGTLRGTASQAGDSNIQKGENEYVDLAGCTDGEPATASPDCGGFTSIGLKGHYMVVGVDGFDIEAGDQVVVHEVPNCSLDFDNTRSEPSRVDVSVLSKDGLWYEVASDFDGGQGDFTVVADPGVSESKECEPCDPADDTDGGCMP